jgi:hypothetical protein
MPDILNEYSWKDVEVAINGRPIIGALGINFKETVESELVYGKGNQPLGVNDGNINYEGELVVHQSEFEKLMQATGNRGTTGLKDLTISSAYIKDGRITSRILIGVRITEIGEAYNQNDKFAEITLPFIFLGWA